MVLDKCPNCNHEANFHKKLENINGENNCDKNGPKIFSGYRSAINGVWENHPSRENTNYCPCPLTYEDVCQAILTAKMVMYLKEFMKNE